MTRTRVTLRTLVAMTLLAALLGWLQLGSGTAEAAPPADAGQSDCAGQGIPASKIGIQLYTYGSGGAINADGIEAVVEHMADVGIRNFERYAGTFDLELDEFAELLQDNRTRPVSSHGSLDLDSWDEELAEAKALNQKYIGSGGFGGPGFGSLEDTLQTAQNLNELGERALKQGLKLIVHNHDGEFTTTYMYDLDGDGVEEETPVIEIVLANTDPRYVNLELDIHWARVGLAGGRGNPDLEDNLADESNHEMLLDFIEQYEDRIVLTHVKDTAEDGSITDVGEGTTDWATVLAAAGSVKYHFIEYDRTPDAYHTAEAGFDYLTCLTL